MFRRQEESRIQVQEDENLARFLQEEEEKYAARGNSVRLRELQEAAGLALAKYMQSQYDGSPPYTVEAANREYQAAAERLRLEESRLPPAKPVLSRQLPVPAAASPRQGGSATVIHSALGSAQEKKQPAIQAEHVFSADEMLKIKHHYETLPEELKKLIDSALSDERITLDYITNPAFIRGEGHIYDRSTILDILKGKDSAPCPYNPGRLFRQSDIIPCNTLIKAMRQLLNIIGGDEPVPPSQRDDILFNNKSNDKRKLITPEQIALIEIYYEKFLLPRQKVLFDIICRDPFTGIIMDDPVLLPDGHVYDRTTIALVKRFSPGDNKYPCPGNRNISFTDEDVTTCYFVASVLEQLKQNIEARRKMMAEAEARAMAEGASPNPEIKPKR